MTISIDRSSGLFTPEVSDRINTQSEDLYNSIMDLAVPEKLYKEDVDPFQINSPFEHIRNNNIRIGRANVVNFVITDSINSGGGWFEVGTVPTGPTPTDILVINGQSTCMWRMDAGSNKLLINTFGSTLPAVECFFVYCR